MTANHSNPARGGPSDRELDMLLSAANDELLNYVRANANSRATLLRIMEIRDKEPDHQIQRDGPDKPVTRSQPGREPRDWETLRRWDPERIGPYVVLGRLGSGSMGQVYLGRSAAGGWSRSRRSGWSWPRRPVSGPGSRRRWRRPGR